MSNEYKEKLKSLQFRTQKAGPKVMTEGDRREGSVTTLDDERQSVNVFIPPVNVEMDMPMWNDTKEQVADEKADTVRQAKEITQQ
jgi:hypothetical protein